MPKMLVPVWRTLRKSLKRAFFLVSIVSSFTALALSPARAVGQFPDGEALVQELATQLARLRAYRVAATTFTQFLNDGWSVTAPYEFTLGIVGGSRIGDRVQIHMGVGPREHGSMLQFMRTALAGATPLLESSEDWRIDIRTDLVVLATLRFQADLLSEVVLDDQAFTVLADSVTPSRSPVEPRLTGLGVKIFHVASKRSDANRIANALRRLGMEVTLSLADARGASAHAGNLYYSFRYLREAQEIARVAAVHEDVALVVDNRPEQGLHFYLWLVR